MDKLKISEYAKQNNQTYKQVWASIKDGTFPEKTETTKSGSIFILKESKASENKEKQKVEFATPLFADFGEKQESKASVRRNRSATITPTDQYKHINEGLDIYNLGGRNSNGNNDCIDVSEAIRLTRKCYYNFSDLRNICDTLVDFSTSPIYYRGGNAKSRKFFEALFNKIGIINLQQKFFMEYYRSCNVFPYRYEAIIKDDDLANLNKTYGANAAKKTKLPTKYVIIDPSSVIVGGNISFSNPLFYQRLNSYEVQRLIKPITQDDKDFLASLPEDVRKGLSKQSTNQSLDIPLSPDYVYFIFYKKSDYEPLASPMAFPVLRDINAKEELKRTDAAISRTTLRAVLHIAMGFENKNGEIFIDAKAMEATRALFESESIGKVLVTDFATKIEWKIPDISKLLGPEKYKQLNDDIRSGLNNILIGTDEKFANQSIKVKLFIQRLIQSREAFLNEFLIPEIKRISKDMGFRSYPEPFFEDIDFKDSDLFSRVLSQLAGIGYLTPEQVFEGMDTGRLPNQEESEEAQRRFKKLKDEGLYQTPQANPSTQLEVLTEQNKQSMKVMDKTHEFESKEKGKDRKHAAENPQQPAPQILVNAPTKMAQPKGKPAGSRNPGGLKKKTAKPISASLIRDNLIIATKLNKELNKQLCEKFKLEKLNETQDILAGELLENIMCGEKSEKWIESISTYLKNPDHVNQERFEEVRQLGEELELDDYSAAIAYNSQKEE
jgi:hypothetical protein